MIDLGSPEYLEIMARLRAAIKGRGYHFKDAANYINVDPAAITQWTMGLRPFPLDRFLAICEFVDVDPRDMCGDLTKPKEEPIIVQEPEGGVPAKRRA